MRPINIKQLATFSFAALLLASCSDNANDAINGSDTAANTTIVGSAVTSVTDAQELAAQVSNLKIQDTNTRAYSGSDFSEVSSMPEEPKVPQDATPVTDNTYVAQGTYYIPKGTNITRCFPNGSTVYVENGATLTWNDWSDGTTIYVLSGGKLIANSGIELSKQCTIYNYGTIDYNSDNIIALKPLYTKGDLDLTGKTFNVQNKCYIGGNLTATTFANSYMTMYVVGDCTIGSITDGKLNGSKLNVGGKFTINGDLAFNNAALFVSGCSVNVEGNLELANWGSSLYVDYLKAKNITLSSGSSIYLKNKSMISCTGKFDSNNQDNAKIYLNEDGATAAIKAGMFQFNNGQALDKDNKIYKVTMFSTSGKNPKIVVDGVFTKDGDDVITPVFDANVYPYTDTENVSSISIPKTKCNPEGYNDKEDGGDSGKTDGGNTDSGKIDGSDTKKDEGTKGSLDLISVIEYPNHTHDISATGIMPLNGKMYMSYHTRGDKETTETGHGGCVEVFTPVTNDPATGKKVTMLQYLYDEGKDLDFNHILAVTHENESKVTESKVYMPGSSNKKGAMLAYMDILGTGLLNDQSKAITTSTDETDANGNKKTTITYQQPLQFIQMNKATADFKGYDENCVVYNEETKHLIVMTTKGYLVYDLNYNEVDRVEKPGKAKHVAIGNGKIATLFFKETNTDVTAAIPARVEIFDQKTEDLKTPIKAFDVSTIQPNNGKNVIAIDGNYLYVCRGAAGMYVYDMNTGDEVWHYQMPNAQIKSDENGKEGEYKALANGLFVGDQYIYVAYGSYGIVVLDKTTHEVVAHRAISKSANYVYVYDGYIYVAYGKDRLQVFQLYVDGQPSTDYGTKK